MLAKYTRFLFVFVNESFNFNELKKEFNRKVEYIFCGGKNKH